MNRMKGRSGAGGVRKIGRGKKRRGGRRLQDGQSSNEAAAGAGELLEKAAEKGWQGRGPGGGEPLSLHLRLCLKTQIPRDARVSASMKRV